MWKEIRKHLIYVIAAIAAAIALYSSRHPQTPDYKAIHDIIDGDSTQSQELVFEDLKNDV